MLTVPLKNPIMIASGTFGYDGYGRGMPDYADLSLLGAIIPKTVTRFPKAGNPEPRWYPKSFREGYYHTHDNLFINSIGLENPGIEYAMSDMVYKWERYGTTVILSVSATSAVEFNDMGKMTRGVKGFQAVELNLSCPNIEDGSVYGQDKYLAARAVDCFRAGTNNDLPIIVKLPPNVPNIVDIVREVVAVGADAVTLCNTMPAMRLDYDMKPVLGNVLGGLSGEALRPISLALVYQVAQSVDIPIFGVGGIFNYRNALEYFTVGATAVQIGSACLVNPYIPWRILADRREEYNNNA